MVAQGGVELHARIQQNLVGPFELILVVARLVPAVHVVAQHKYEIKRSHLARLAHLDRDFVLRQLSGSHVADYSKSHGVRLRRREQFLAEKRHLQRSQSHAGNEMPTRNVHGLKPQGMAFGMKSTIRFVFVP